MAQGSKSNIRWLEGELKRWVSGGIIDDGRAEAIRGLYPVEQAARPWALIVFSGIGAVIVGLGIVLLFAYNWQYMSKAAKLSVVFASLIISHTAGIWLFLKSERFRGVGEALSVLGSMLFGAGIWLVAQIYHIEEHYPTAFLFWGLGTLVLAWAMPSIMQAIMAAILFTIWAGVEAAEFHAAMHWAIPLILSLWVLAYLRRSIILLGVLILASGFVLGFLSSGSRHEIVFAALFSLAVLYVSLGFISQGYWRFPESSPVFLLFGMAAYFVMLYLLTFHDIARDIFRFELPTDTVYVFYWLVPPALAIVGWLLAGWLKMKKRAECHFDFFLMPLALILCYCQMIFLKAFNEWSAAAVLFNFVFLAHAVSMMARGCRDVKIVPAIVGSLLLAALTIARYFDLFDSLAIRGFVFIAVGVILFAQGFFYIRAKKKQSMEAAI
jgi:uncharacterized membrane protein